MRMACLNPDRLVAMIVDRVTLVYQQAACIEKYTGLNMLRLCMETTTVYAKSNLFKRMYNGVVSTAGSWKTLQKFPQFAFSSFSIIVFDECHHAGDNKHAYTDILSTLSDSIPKNKAPRLVGLSASPVKADSIGSALKESEFLVRKFGSAEFFMPKLTDNSKLITEWILVAFSELQERLKNSYYFHLRYVLSTLGILGDYKNFDRSGWGQLVGLSRSLRLVRGEIAEDIEKTINALDMNEIFGPYYALKYFNPRNEPDTQIECKSELLVTLENKLA